MSANLAELLPIVQAHVVERRVPIPGWRTGEAERRQFQAAVAQALVELRLDRDLDGNLAEAAAHLAGMMTGVGVLQSILAEPGVEEVIVRDGFVQVERRGVIEDCGCLAGEAHFRQAAQWALVVSSQMIMSPKGNRSVK